MSDEPKKPRKVKKVRKFHARAPVFMGRKLNMTKFAQKHGLSRSYMHKLLRGDISVSKIPVEKAELFAATFNCTIEDLILALRQRAEIKKPLDHQV